MRRTTPTRVPAGPDARENGSAALGFGAVGSLHAPPSADPKPSGVLAGERWVMQIVVPAVAWLVVNCLLFGLFTAAASMLFGLLTALWAAIDCSKLRSSGSRVLGLAFKPVVVFAVCAFFLWGLGFIWYLVMRYRVKTAPTDFANENERVGVQTGGSG